MKCGCDRALCFLCRLALAASFTVFGAVAQAASITTYDIKNANVSNTGGWFHTYTGTISLNGTVSAYDGWQLADYTGGFGTLNNGAGTGTSDTQLFWTPDNPIITVFFDAYYTLDDILLETWPDVMPYSNGIPGTMTGFTAAIGGTSQAFLTTNAPNRAEFVNFSGSSLDGVATNMLTLSNFSGTFSSYVAISNIVVNGQPALAPSAVPLPAGLLLLPTAIGAFALTRRRKIKPLRGQKPSLV